MVPLSATWRYIMCHLMALLPSCSRMLEMSPKGLNPHVRDLNGAWIRMELASMCEYVYSIRSLVLFVSLNHLEMSLILGQISTSLTQLSSWLLRIHGWVCALGRGSFALRDVEEGNSQRTTQKARCRQTTGAWASLAHLSSLNHMAITGTDRGSDTQSRGYISKWNCPAQWWKYNSWVWRLLEEPDNR